MIQEPDPEAQSQHDAQETIDEFGHFGEREMDPNTPPRELERLGPLGQEARDELLGDAASGDQDDE